MSKLLRFFYLYGTVLETPGSLDLTGHSFTNQQAQNLANCPHLASLREILFGTSWFGKSYWTVQGFKLFFASPYLCSIERMSFGTFFRRGTSSMDPYAFPLADAAHVRSLQTIDIGENALGIAGWSALASSPYLARVRALSVGNSDVCTSLKAHSILMRRKGIVEDPLRGWSPDPPVRPSSLPRHYDDALGTWSALQAEIWRLFAYACLSEEEQASVRSDFLDLAESFATSSLPPNSEKERGWRWIQGHLRSWRGAALKEASVRFPALVELQLAIDHEQARISALEEPLF